MDTNIHGMTRKTKTNYTKLLGGVMDFKEQTRDYTLSQLVITSLLKFTAGSYLQASAVLVFPSPAISKKQKV